jgi:hypothetical protein
VNSADRAAELRALADQLDATAAHELEAADAKAAYREALASGDEEQIAACRGRHREASDALAAARAETRKKVVVASAEPGSATVIPSAVNVGLTGQEG